MKKFVIISIISIIVIIVLTKLIRSPKPLTPSKLSAIEQNRKSERFNERLDSEGYNSREQVYRDYNGTRKGAGGINTEIKDRILWAYAKAFVEVQSYMNSAGSKVNYKETTKIVRKNGLSTEGYTSIATLMNKNPAFREKVQRMINEIKQSNY